MTKPLTACQFRDTAGRTWTVDLHPLVIEGLRGKQGHMLLGGLIVQVLYTLLEDQIEGEGITPDEFAAGFGGDVIEHAVAAIMRAVEDMLPAGDADKLRELIGTLDGLSITDSTGGD
jgi:hypothetical protein